MTPREEKRREENKEEEIPPLPPADTTANGVHKPKRKAEYEAAADRVVDHYQSAVKPGHTKARGVHNVVGLLRKGATEESLLRAADGYADWCKRNNRDDPTHRFSVGNFYGRDNPYKEFVGWTQQPEAAAMTEEEKLEYTRKKMEEWDRIGKKI